MNSSATLVSAFESILENREFPLLSVFLQSEYREMNSSAGTVESR